MHFSIICSLTKFIITVSLPFWHSYPRHAITFIFATRSTINWLTNYRLADKAHTFSRKPMILKTAIYLLFNSLMQHWNLFVNRLENGILLHFQWNVRLGNKCCGVFFIIILEHLFTVTFQSCYHGCEVSENTVLVVERWNEIWMYWFCIYLFAVILSDCLFVTRFLS